MPSVAVREVPVPPECGIAHLSHGADLADAFAITLPHGVTHDADALARAIFGHQPVWVRGLMSVRDAVVGRFGLKTALHLRSGRDGDRVGIFRVYERYDRELIAGEDDRHLDFRVSVLVRPVGLGDDEVVVSTVVHCHNLLGRTYLAAIKPFHRLVVPADLRNAARHAWKPPSV